MVQISQFLAAGILVTIWGILTLALQGPFSRHRIGLLQILVGTGLLTGSISVYFTPGMAQGEFFFGTVVTLLSGIILLLLKNSPGSESADSAGRMGKFSAKVNINSPQDVLRLLNSAVEAGEETDFRGHLILYFFLVVMILLIKLT